MSKHCKCSSAGLLALVALGVASIVPLPAAKGGKPQPPPPPPPFKYEMTLLSPLLGSTGMYAGVINNLGDLPGWATMADGTSHGWVRRAATGAVEDLNATILGDDNLEVQCRPGVPQPALNGQGGFAAAAITTANAINDVGQICGHIDYLDIGGTLRSCAYRFTPGYTGSDGTVYAPVLLVLDTPPGDGVRYVWAINLLGDVLCGFDAPFVCLSGGGIIDLDLPGGPTLDYHRSEYGAMNDQGQVVFMEYTPDTIVGGTLYPRAYRYEPDTGQLTDLGSLNPAPPNLVASSGGFSINNAGQVTGNSIVGSEKIWFKRYRSIYHAYRYTDGSGMIDLGLPPGGYTRTVGGSINGQGEVLGRASMYVTVQGVENFVSRPCLYTSATGMIELWPLIVDPKGINATDVVCNYIQEDRLNMNDSGTIVGRAETGGVSEVFILKRVPR